MIQSVIQITSGHIFYFVFVFFVENEKNLENINMPFFCRRRDNRKNSKFKLDVRFIKSF